MKKFIQTLKADFSRNPFKAKDGSIVVAQSPNLPLIAFVVAKIIQKPSSGIAEQVFSALAFGALFTWAWLEIFQGSNAFRRILGVVVMVAAVRGLVGL